MSCTLIAFEKEHDRFSFGADPYTWDELGVRIAAALKDQTELVDFGCVRVTVGYLTGMMRFARKHGWFWDNFDIGNRDHQFDVNVPTPGRLWGAMRKLQRKAPEFRRNARMASAANVHADAEYWLGEARKFEEAVREYLTSGEFDEFVVSRYLSDHEE
jgi:hypothetical protein